LHLWCSRQAVILNNADTFRSKLGPVMAGLLGSAVKKFLQRRGLMLVNPDFRWGVSVFSDIRRLAQSQGWSLDQVFDVGAHLGEWAGTALTEFASAQVCSFEPFPESFTQLQQKLGGHTRSRQVNLAASDSTGEKQFHLYENSCLNSLTDSSAWTVKANWSSMASIVVRSVRLDEWCESEKVAQVDVLKVDTEGFDLQVLQGATGLFERRAVRFVFVEFNDLQPREAVTGGALLPIDSLLRSFGFRFINTYVDNVGVQGQLFVTSNALFMLQP
jgi:FkbM family methyltransferase